MKQGCVVLRYEVKWSEVLCCAVLCDNKWIWKEKYINDGVEKKMRNYWKSKWTSLNCECLSYKHNLTVTSSFVIKQIGWFPWQRCPVCGVLQVNRFHAFTFLRLLLLISFLWLLRLRACWNVRSQGIYEWIVCLESWVSTAYQATSIHCIKHNICTQVKGQGLIIQLKLVIFDFPSNPWIPTVSNPLD